jgi:hypothetical protein
VATTLAPTTDAPDGSVTVPTNDPVVAWPAALCAFIIRIKNARQARFFDNEKIKDFIPIPSTTLTVNVYFLRSKRRRAPRPPNSFAQYRQVATMSRIFNRKDTFFAPI